MSIALEGIYVLLSRFNNYSLLDCARMLGGLLAAFPHRGSEVNEG